jgi:shikimate dehydrogenase
VTRLPERYAVIGQPIEHSRSPFIHAHFAKATGEVLTYDRIEASPEDFADIVRTFFADGGGGLNVTVPHKETAAALCDELSERAALAGAVNTLIPLPDGRLRGDNTDGVGLVTDLEHNLGVTLSGRRLLILGAGGATRGVLAPLLSRAPAQVLVVNRTAARAEELAARFAARGPIEGGGLDRLDSAGSFELIINATSAGLNGEAIELPASCVRPETVGYDMLYQAGGTPFSRQLQALGAQATWLGHGMLVEQAAESFFLWRGVRPPTTDVLALLRSPGGAVTG